MWTGPRAVIVGSILVAAACQGNTAVAPPPSASTPATAPATTPSASPVPTATPIRGPANWRRVARDLPENSSLNDVATIGQTVVAVGSTGTEPLVETSTDGIVWQPSTNPIESVGGAGMSGLVPASPGLLAVGGGDAGSVVWTTADGSTWQKVYAAAAGATPYAVMDSVAAGGPGFVAVGLGVPGLVDDFGGAAWTSPNGRDWVMAPSTSQLLRAPLKDVVSTPKGLVAVGGIGGAVSLTSTDGSAWILHEQKDVLKGGQFWSVAIRPDGGFVGVGGGNDAFSALSDDGAGWLPGPCTGSLTDASLRDVVAVPTGFVASGEVAGRAAVWYSLDGDVWSRVNADLGEGLITAIAVTPHGLVAVGTSIWLGPLDGVGQDGTYPRTPCGAPVPVASGGPGPAATPGASSAVVQCVQSAVPGAPVPSGLAKCADLGIGCEVPDPAPPVVLCKVEEPALPPSAAPAAS